MSLIPDSIGGPERYDLYNPINEPTPLMPEKLQIVIQEIARNSEVMTLFNKIAGGERLPDREAAGVESKFS